MNLKGQALRFHSKRYGDEAMEIAALYKELWKVELFFQSLLAGKCRDKTTPPFKIV